MSPCPRCGNALQWVPQYNQWWCQAEKQYLAPAPVQGVTQPQAVGQPTARPAVVPDTQYTCPECRQPLTWLAQNGQWYCYAEQKYYPPANLAGASTAPSINRRKVKFPCSVCGGPMKQVRVSPATAFPAQYEWYCKACGEVRRPKWEADQVAQDLRMAARASSNITFNITKSPIGILNTGEIRDVESITANATSLLESGNAEMAQALKALAEAIISSEDTAPNQREELLDQLGEVSRQAALLPKDRAKRGVLSSLLNSLSTGANTVKKLGEAWAQWGPVVLRFLGAPS